MNCIQVNTGTPYQVLIRRGILQDAGEEVKKVKPYARLAVVTDSNVSPLYLRNLLDSLERPDTKIFYLLQWQRAKIQNLWEMPDFCISFCPKQKFPVTVA